MFFIKKIKHKLSNMKSSVMTASLPQLGAIAFDAYGTLFDVYSVGALAEQMFPGRGDALAQLLGDEAERIAMTRAGHELLDSGRGALARTLELLRPALPPVAGP